MGMHVMSDVSFEISFYGHTIECSMVHMRHVHECIWCIRCCTYKVWVETSRLCRPAELQGPACQQAYLANIRHGRQLVSAAGAKVGKVLPYVWQQALGDHRGVDPRV